MSARTNRRELIEPHLGDKRYVRRNKLGQFKTSVSVRRSLSDDVRKHAKKTIPPGQGDRGDQKRHRGTNNG